MHGVNYALYLLEWNYDGTWMRWIGAAEIFARKRAINYTQSDREFKNENKIKDEEENKC